GRGGVTNSRACVVLLGLGLLAAPLRGAEVERTLRAELSGADAADFQVENLLGTMRISEGSGNTVTVVATVYAEDASLADAVKLERVSGGNRSATLRVRYPYDRVSTFRYRSPTEQHGFSLLDFGSTSTYEYDGRSVDVNPSHGK